MKTALLGTRSDCIGHDLSIRVSQSSFGNITITIFDSEKHHLHRTSTERGMHTDFNSLPFGSTRNPPQTQWHRRTSGENINEPATDSKTSNSIT
jgi:hypothetical protein